METDDDGDVDPVTTYINQSVAVESTADFGEDPDKGWEWALSICENSSRWQTEAQAELRQEIDANGANKTIDPLGLAEEDEES